MQDCHNVEKMVKGKIQNEKDLHDRINGISWQKYAEAIIEGLL